MSRRIGISRAARSSEAEERPSPPADGGNRRPHDRVRVRRTARSPARLHRLGAQNQPRRGRHTRGHHDRRGGNPPGGKVKNTTANRQHLVRAFEAGFEVGAKPIDEAVVEAVLSLRIDDLEPRLTRSGYDVRSLAEQFDAKPAEIRRLLRGDLDPARSRELMDEMRQAGLPT